MGAQGTDGTSSASSGIRLKDCSSRAPRTTLSSSGILVPRKSSRHCAFLLVSTAQNAADLARTQSRPQEHCPSVRLESVRKPRRDRFEGPARQGFRHSRDEGARHATRTQEGSLLYVPSPPPSPLADLPLQPLPGTQSTTTFSSRAARKAPSSTGRCPTSRSRTSSSSRTNPTCGPLLSTRSVTFCAARVTTIRRGSGVAEGPGRGCWGIGSIWGGIGRGSWVQRRRTRVRSIASFLSLR